MTLFVYACVGLYLGQIGGRMFVGDRSYLVCREEDPVACAALAKLLKPAPEPRPCGAVDVDANGAQVSHV